MRPLATKRTTLDFIIRAVLIIGTVHFEFCIASALRRRRTHLKDDTTGTGLIAVTGC